MYRYKYMHIHVYVSTLILARKGFSTVYIFIHNNIFPLVQIKRNKIPLKHVRPPSVRKVVEASVDSTLTRIKAVDPAHLKAALPAAKKVS